MHQAFTAEPEKIHPVIVGAWHSLRWSFKNRVLSQIHTVVLACAYAHGFKTRLSAFLSLNFDPRSPLSPPLLVKNMLLNLWLPVVHSDVLTVFSSAFSKKTAFSLDFWGSSPLWESPASHWGKEGNVLSEPNMTLQDGLLEVLGYLGLPRCMWATT